MSSEISFDAYMQIGGVKGESVQKDHKEWIDVDTFSYGVTRGSNMDLGGGTTGKASFPGVSFVHLVDSTSPTLFQFCASGKHIEKCVLQVCKSTGDAGSVPFITVTLNDVVVTEVSPGGGSGGAPTENVVLSYAKIEVQVKSQQKNGQLGPAVIGTWDIKQNTK